MTSGPWPTTGPHSDGGGSCRVLRDVSQLDPAVTILGREWRWPIWIATAFHRMAHPDGEMATARAASSA